LPTNGNVTIALFAYGADILSNNYIYVVNDVSPYTFNYTLGSGTYFLRFETVSTTPISLKIDIKINEGIVRSFYDTIAPTRRIAIKQFATSNTCKMRVYYTGPSIPIAFFAPGIDIYTQAPVKTMQPTSPGSTYVDIDVISPGIWNIVLYHNISSTISLSNINLTLNTFT
jgi:hypothetical protein